MQLFVQRRNAQKLRTRPRRVKLFDKNAPKWYNILSPRASGRGAAGPNGRRDGSSDCGGGTSSPSAEAEGGDDMVTYGDMFAYTLVLISVVGLCVQIAQFRNKKK